MRARALRAGFGAILISIAPNMLPASVSAPEAVTVAKRDYPIHPVPATSVRLSDPFWQPRIARNHKITLPAILRKLKETGRIRNFENAAKVVSGESPREPFATVYAFDDSDLYKWIEAASSSLMIFPDPGLKAEIDALIKIIGAAQEADGYLYTARTVDPSQPIEMAGKLRWDKEDEGSHELYNAGHLYEAAEAHFRATGERTLLEIALKNADLIDRTFGFGKLEKAPNHPEIEIGLVKLYRATGDERYLNLAQFFLEVRGYKGETYSQQHQRPIDQTEAVGHAVRAAYLYCGMADVVALTGKKGLRAALDAIWIDAIGGKTYLTGGIGSTSDGEAFGKPFDLPNQTAYCETCASIGSMLWNQRMFLLTGDAKYIDVLERTLYNGFLSGVSLSGDRFFYSNPLESWGHRTRSEWFACACCPPNLARTLPWLPSFFYATAKDRVFVNLYATSHAEVDLDGAKIALDQKTAYPWAGEVTIQVTPPSPRRFAIALRVPGWARDRPIPIDLYGFTEPDTGAVKLTVNGKPAEHSPQRGYIVIDKVWSDGDTIALSLPMPVRRVVAHPRVEADQNRVALQRGPLVYCAEGVDNDSSALTLVVPEKTAFRTESRPDLLGGLTVITGGVQRGQIAGSTHSTKGATLMAIPYYAWANRQPSDMTVFMATRSEAVTHFPEPATLATASQASASYAYDNSLPAVNDGFTPKSSADRSNDALRFYPHRGTTEWVRYDFRRAEGVSSAKVYWLQDGSYQLPVSWRILYLRDDGEWEEVKNPSPYSIEANRFNMVTFERLKTRALKLEVTLREDGAGGIIEWAVN